METVFVGNLSYFCTKQALADFFAPLGPVRDINIRLTNRKLPLHYGFVEMSSEMAKIACEEWNNKVLLGRKIRYAPTQLLSTGDGQRSERLVSQNQHSQGNQRRGAPSIHVSLAPPQFPLHHCKWSLACGPPSSTNTAFVSQVSEQINETYLTNVFARFGGLEDCVVKSHKASKNKNRQGGYAFLYFKDLPSAENVLRTIKTSGGALEGVSYDAKFSVTSLGLESDQQLRGSTDSEYSAPSSPSLSAPFPPQVRPFHLARPGLSLNMQHVHSSLSSGSLSSNSSFCSGAPRGYGSSLPSPMSVKDNGPAMPVHHGAPGHNMMMMHMPAPMAAPSSGYSVVPMTAPNGVVYHMMLPPSAPHMVNGQPGQSQYFAQPNGVASAMPAPQPALPSYHQPMMYPPQPHYPQPSMPMYAMQPPHAPAQPAAACYYVNPGAFVPNMVQ